MGYALVTGASRGIGEALAEALAARGRNLILTARNADDLERVGSRVRRHGIEVECVPADLSARSGAGELLDRIGARNWEIDLLVNNAGLGSRGEFAALALERELDEVQVNVAAAVELTHGVLPEMRRRRRGEIVNVSSVAAYQAVPGMATYAATKVFLLHFSLALWAEMRGEGIHVMALCPGATRTNFFAAAGMQAPRGQSPQRVAALALRGLEQRRPVVVCGAGNRALTLAVGWLPRTGATRAAGAVTRRRLRAQ
jgi:short-subunit dehydrogenase